MRNLARSRPCLSSNCTSVFRPSRCWRPLELVTMARFFRLEHTVEVGFHMGLFSTALSRTTNVEGPHGQLGARLTNGLGRDHADRFTDIHRSRVPGHDHNTLAQIRRFGFTGQNRADLRHFNASFVDDVHIVFANISLRATSTSPVSGWHMSSAAVRPSRRSARVSITSPESTTAVISDLARCRNPLR